MLDSLSKDEIKKIFDTGKKHRGNIFSVITAEGAAGPARFAVITGKKIKINRRNAVKRRIREIIRGERPGLKQGNNFLILTSEKILKLPFSGLKTDVITKLKELGIL